MNKEIILAAFMILECEPGCSMEEIRASFRQMVKVWHPDRFPNDPKLQHKATEKLKLINEAYDLLKQVYSEVEQDADLESQPRATAQPTFVRTESQPKKSDDVEYKVGQEKIEITKEWDANTKQLFYKKIIVKVLSFDGRHVSIQTKIFTTKPVPPNESFEEASTSSMSFSLSPEQGARRVCHTDGSSFFMPPSEHEWSGNDYVFSDGSTVSIHGQTTDLFFHDENKKADWCRRSSNLHGLDEGYIIFKKRQNWQVCFEITQRAIDLHANNCWGWIHRSFALNRLSKTKEAYESLRQAFEMFPKNATISYNLACYSSLLGDTRAAKDWLKSAFRLALKDGSFDKYRKMAIEDIELSSIRNDVTKIALLSKLSRFF